MTQKQRVIAVLNNNIGKWLPAWYFVGVKRISKGVVYLSYKAPTRLSDVYKEFDLIMERKKEFTQGSSFFSYKLNSPINE